MPTQPSAVIGCLLIAVLAAARPASAQAPAADAAPAVALSTPEMVPLHELSPDPAGGGGGVFGAGADYKVCFRSGMRFVPYLGSSYPHNQPFGWRTTAVTLGGEPLPLQRAEGRVSSPTRYEFALGPVIEAYDLRLSGLEQTFVFATRPGHGELRIRGELQTALHTTDGDHGHAALTFVDAAGQSIVGYGAATAVDANGDRFPLRTIVGQGTIELALDAAAVAAAAFPLVVDPLLTNRVLSTSGTLPLGQPRATDVARDDSNNQLLVAIQRHASATDEDLFLRLFSDAFAASLGIVFTDLDDTWDTTEPQVTFVGGANRWVAAFTREFDSLGTKQVRWHPHVAGSAALDTTVGFLVPPGGFSDLHPAIGGYAALFTGVHAVLCFQRDRNLGANGSHTSDDVSRIWFVRIDVTGTTGGGGAGTLGPVTEVTGTDPAGACDRERPAINRMSLGTTSTDFLIAFQTYWNSVPGGVDDWDVEGRRLDGSGAFLPGVWVSSSNFPNGWHKLGPRVDGIAEEFAIGYTLADNTIVPAKATTIEGSRVACETYDFSGSSLVAPVVLHDTGFVKSLVLTGLSYDYFTRSHALAVFHDRFTNRLHAEKIGYRNQTVEQFVVYDTSGHQPTGGGAQYDDDNDRYVFVFGVEDGATQPVYGNVVTYVATPVPASGGNAGCAQGVIEWTSFHRIGHQHGVLSLIGGPPGRVAVALVSLGAANTPLAPYGFGPCNLLVDLGPLHVGSTSFVTDGSGNARLVLPMPEGLVPFTGYFQWIVLGSPAATATRASPRLAVVFDR